MDEIGWIDAVSDGLVLPCAICGKKNIKFDYNVTDNLWNQVVPKNIRRKVICLECFDKLAKEKGIKLSEGIQSIQFTGLNEIIEFVAHNAFYYHKDRRDKMLVGTDGRTFTRGEFKKYIDFQPSTLQKIVWLFFPTQFYLKWKSYKMLAQALGDSRAERALD